jgi:RNA recognition motif-containing protein
MKIFVAKLNFKTPSEDLQALFEQFGKVNSAKVILDHETGKSRGFGFVDMPDAAEAAKAIAELDGVEYQNSVIVCKEATDNRGGGNSQGGGGYNNNRNNNRRNDYNSNY